MEDIRKRLSIRIGSLIFPKKNLGDIISTLEPLRNIVSDDLNINELPLKLNKFALSFLNKKTPLLLIYAFHADAV